MINLEEINLVGNKFDDEGSSKVGKILCDSFNTTKLRVLELGDNNLTNKGGITLVNELIKFKHEPK